MLTLLLGSCSMFSRCEFVVIDILRAVVKIAWGFQAQEMCSWKCGFVVVFEAIIRKAKGY